MENAGHCKRSTMTGKRWTHWSTLMVCISETTNGHRVTSKEKAKHTKTRQCSGLNNPLQIWTRMVGRAWNGNIQLNIQRFRSLRFATAWNVYMPSSHVLLERFDIWNLISTKSHARNQSTDGPSSRPQLFSVVWTGRKYVGKKWTWTNAPEWIWGTAEHILHTPHLLPIQICR